MAVNLPDSSRDILRRVGIALIAVGLIDIGYMLYCIANHINDLSILGIILLIFGIFLIRGNLRLAGVVTFISAVSATSMVGLLLIFVPFLEPLDLFITQFRLAPWETIGGLAIFLAKSFFLIWIYRQLRSPAVVDARIAAGRSGWPPIVAFIVGAIGVAVLGIAMQSMLHGEHASKAIEIVKSQVGPGYKFHVSSLTIQRSGQTGTTGKSTQLVWANVVAYKPDEILSVPVEFSQ